MVSQPSVPIAVVGSGCRFPGGASSPSALWKLLQDPPDVAQDIPTDRFDTTGHYHPNGSHHGTTNVRQSYLLQDDIRVFDAAFFNISPNEADSIEPQQRLLIETVYEAMESGGHAMEKLRGSDSTKAGNPKEAAAISKCFPQKGENGSPLYVGSVKTVIGHTEGAAGLAGLLKGSEIIQNGLIPPNFLFNSLNPDIEPHYKGLHVPTTLTPWPKLPEGVPRRVSVNSFGFGGSNAHAILEEYRETPGNTTVVSLKSDADPPNAPFTPFVFSAKASFSAATIEQLTSKIDDKLAGVKQTPGKHVFTGQDAQWAAISARLIRSSDFVRRRVQDLEGFLATLLSSSRPQWNLRDEMLAGADTSRIAEAKLSQPLCTAIQIVLVGLLQTAGITFTVVVGHPSGEIGAAYAAGFLSDRDAIRVAYYRGLYARLAGFGSGQKGALLAVGTDWKDSQELINLRAFRGRIAIAAKNSSASVTLSGDADAIVHAKKVFDEEKKFGQTTKAGYGLSLSSHVAVWQPIHQCLATMEAGEALQSVYWRDNMTNAVLFSDAVKNAVASDPQLTLALEVGPHPALQGPTTQNISDVRSAALPYCGVLSRGKDDVQVFADSLGFIWTHLGGQSVEFASYEKAMLSTPPGSAQQPTLMVGLPSYQWNHGRTHWHESRISRKVRGRKQAFHELLGVQSHGWGGHQLQGQTVFPAAGYVAMAVEAARTLAADRSVELFEFHNLTIPRAITFEEDVNSGVETLITLTAITAPNLHDQTSTADFSCYSCPSTGADQEMELMASGSVKIVFGAPSVAALASTPLDVSNMSSIDTNRFYASLGKLGYGYYDNFRGMSSLKRRLNQSSVLVGTYPYTDDDLAVYLVHPTLLDVAFQASMLAYSAPGDERLWSLHVPTFIGRIRFNKELCLSLPTSGSRVPVCAILADTKELYASIDLFSEDGQQGMVQAEDLTIKPFAPATKADDRRLFSHTLFDVAAPDGTSIVRDIKSSRIAEEVEEYLGRFCGQIIILNGLPTEDEALTLNPMSTFVNLVDLDYPIFEQMTADKMEGLKRLFELAKHILWITQGAQADEPYHQASFAFSRAMSHEAEHISLHHLDVSDLDHNVSKIIAEYLLRQCALDEWEAPKDSPQHKQLLWSREPEAFVDQGKLKIPRLVDSVDQNARLNSNRRVINKTVPIAESNISISLSADTPPALVEQVLSVGPKDDQSLVRIESSSLTAIHVAADTFLFLGIGKENTTKGGAAVLSTANACKTTPVASVAIDAIESADILLIAIASELLATSMIQTVSSGSSILVHASGKDRFLAAALSRRASANAVRVTFTCDAESNDEARDPSWIHLNARSPKHVVRRALLLAKPTHFLDLTPHTFAEPSILSLSIAQALPAGYKRIDLCGLFQHSSLLPMSCDWGSLTSRLVDAVGSAKKITMAMPVEDVQDLVIPLDQIHDLSLLNHTTSAVHWPLSGDVTVEVRPLDARQLFASDKTYFLVGLTGEIGRSICEWMISNGAGDITDKQNLERVVAKIKATCPPIAGVVNGAMVLHDVLFSRMSLEMMQKVLGPKIDGSNNLDEVFYDDNLDFFIMLSSSASVIGNSGQANYAAANGYLNSLPRQRRKRGLAASTVDIGRVAGIGYVETAGQAVMNQLTRFGLMAISEPEFLQMLAETIRAGYLDPSDKEGIPDAVVMTGIRSIRDDEDIQGPWFDNPRFSHCIVETKSAESGAAQQNKKTLLPVGGQLSRAATTEQALHILIECFSAKLRIILQISEPDINHDAPLVELGVDSLVAVEVRSWFYRIWFTIVDPLLSLLGVYTNFFTPTTVLNSYAPTFVSPPGSETIVLLDTVAAFLVGLIFLELFLLRAKSTDMTVWRALQGSQLLVDIGMLAAFTRALESQGRMDWKVLRAEDWGNYLITAGVAVIRSAFLMGVGMNSQKRKRVE
ncbi:MAG: hypothetical protein Q9185_003579 [Variospora sp. 1 TL-2023]